MTISPLLTPRTDMAITASSRSNASDGIVEGAAAAVPVVSFNFGVAGTEVVVLIAFVAPVDPKSVE